MQRDPWVQVFTRLGSVLGVGFYLVVGLGTALEYGRHIGLAFDAALSETPLGGAVATRLLVFFGSLMGALAGLLVCIVTGALVGGLVGGGLARYVLGPLRASGDPPPSTPEQRP